MAGMKAEIETSQTFDILSNKLKSQEDVIAKKDAEIADLKHKMKDFESSQARVSKFFEDKYQELAIQNAMMEKELAHK